MANAYLPMTVADDAFLVSAARAGDRAAFAELYERHRAMLVALCHHAVGDYWLAEDAAQEAALRAMLGLAQLRAPGRFGAWLCGIGLNVCRDFQRRRAIEGSSWEELVGGRDVVEPVAETDDPERLAEEREIATRVRAAVAELPAGQRAAVLGYYLSGLTVAETAAQLGVSVGALKTRLHKARANLRRELVELWEEMPMSVVRVEGVDVRVGAVLRARSADAESGPIHNHILLEEVNGGRTLTIWVGEPEATATALQLEGVSFPRPQTYDLTYHLLEATGTRVVAVTIERLVDEIFYASVVVEAPTGAKRVDARPSDAINLALLAGAPIRVAEGVFVAASSGEARPPVTIVERGPDIAARAVASWKTFPTPGATGTVVSERETKPSS